MKHAFVFPGQGAQFSGMGKNLYESNSLAKEYFEQANEILGFRITDIMFTGSDEDLKQTKVTQPAIFLHSVILFLTTPDLHPDMARENLQKARTRNPDHDRNAGRIGARAANEVHRSKGWVTQRKNAAWAGHIRWHVRGGRTPQTPCKYCEGAHGTA